MKNIKRFLKNLWGQNFRCQFPRRRICLETLEDRQMLSAVGWDATSVAEIAIQAPFDESPEIPLLGTNAVAVDNGKGELSGELVLSDPGHSLPIQINLDTAKVGDYLATLTFNGSYSGGSLSLAVASDSYFEASLFNIIPNKKIKWGADGKAESLVDGTDKDFVLQLKKLPTDPQFATTTFILTDGSGSTKKQAVETNVSSQTVDWSLTDYCYSDYQLVLNKKSGYMDLQGYDNRAQKWTVLETVSYTDKTELNIKGNDRKTETITVSAGIMENLGTIIYRDNAAKRDKVTIEGSDQSDIYTISRETKWTESGGYNPYKLIMSRSIWTLYETVSLTQTSTEKEDNQGAKLMLFGVGPVTIDAKGGDDTFLIKQMGTCYHFIGGTGEDLIDFSETSRVNIDMGKDSKQCALLGQLGSITLDQVDIERVYGSIFCDSITSGYQTTWIKGNGGSDRLTLNGNIETRVKVELNGLKQCVTAKGSGTYEIEIKEGDCSSVNASQVSSKGVLLIDAEGDRINITGSAGADKITIYGDHANVRGNDGNDTIGVVGSHATINGGKGNDMISIRGSKGGASCNNNLNGDDGNDMIDASQTDGKNTISAGNGNDLVIGGLGADTIRAQSGNNILIGNDGADTLNGGTGQDLLIAGLTNGLYGKSTEEQRKILEDALKIWTNDEYSPFAKIELVTDSLLLGDQSQSDGDKDKISRGNGTYNLIYVNSVPDNDSHNARTDKKSNDVVIDTKQKN